MTAALCPLWRRLRSLPVPKVSLSRHIRTPERAISDGANQVPLADFPGLIRLCAAGLASREGIDFSLERGEGGASGCAVLI